MLIHLLSFRTKRKVDPNFAENNQQEPKEKRKKMYVTSQDFSFWLLILSFHFFFLLLRSGIDSRIVRKDRKVKDDKPANGNSRAKTEGNDAADSNIRKRAREENGAPDSDQRKQKQKQEKELVRVIPYIFHMNRFASVCWGGFFLSYFFL